MKTHNTHEHDKSTHVHSLTTYYLVYVALMVLLAITVGLAFVNLQSLNLPIAMLVAVIKSVLVIAFFMHVKDNPPLIPISIVTGVMMLLVGFVLIFADYMTR